MTDTKEREAFEAWAIGRLNKYGLPYFVFCVKDGEYADGGAQHAWDGWQARAAQPCPVPAGYALVPVEPTEEMIAAASAIFCSNERAALESRTQIYRKMIAAAPSQPATATQARVDVLTLKPGDMLNTKNWGLVEFLRWDDYQGERTAEIRSIKHGDKNFQFINVLQAAHDDWLNAQSAKPATGEGDARIEAILDAADEWADYVDVDRAPMTLRKYLEQALRASKGEGNG